MAFTVSDFHDLIVIMQKEPEWRAEMRRLVLTEEMLDLPQALRDLSQTVREWAEAQRRYEERSEARFGRVEDDIHTLKTDVAVLKTDVARLDSRMGRVDGRTFEQQVRERLPTYLSRFALRLRPVGSADLAELLEIAFEEGRISEAQMDDARLIDAIARGRRRSDSATIYLAAEVSVSVAQHDIERAVRRASIIAAATGTDTLPVIVGEVIPGELRAEAERQGAGYVIVSSD